MSAKLSSHGRKGQYHASLGKWSGGWKCYCGKVRNTQRSLARHIKREGR